MTLVNLLPWRERLIHKRIKYGGCSLAIILLVLFISTQLCRKIIENANKNRTKQVLSWQIEQKKVKESSKKYQLAKSENDYLHQELKKIKEKQNSLIKMKNFITSLEKITPNSLWLTSLNKNQKVLEIKGMSQNIASIITFREQLIKRSSFNQIQLGQIIRGNQGIYRFNLHGIINENNTEE